VLAKENKEARRRTPAIATFDGPKFLPEREKCRRGDMSPCSPGWCRAYRAQVLVLAVEAGGLGDRHSAEDDGAGDRVLSEASAIPSKLTSRPRYEPPSGQHRLGADEGGERTQLGIPGRQSSFTGLLVILEVLAWPWWLLLWCIADAFNVKVAIATAANPIIIWRIVVLCSMAAAQADAKVTRRFSIWFRRAA
jgi:hypothetical protein